MPNKSPKIVSLAAALAALTHGASSVATSAEAKADRGGVLVTNRMRDPIARNSTQSIDYDRR